MPGIEGNTNQLLRKKYFVSSDNVLTKDTDNIRSQRSQKRSPIIDASNVTISENPRLLNQKSNASENNIKVNLVKDESVITAIQISCPCGRHAELNCQYDPAVQQE